MASHNDLGKQGERAAADYLLQLGHTILAQNYRFGRAEVDIISNEKGVIVFTEVKTRSSTQFGLPEEFVDKKKRKLLHSAAGEYMYQNKIETP
ncbi:MAG TPA: YraN family protein, partial [Chitinophagales bacterium]|nr:YraN family protein [Chitinophagales bacterium]